MDAGKITIVLFIKVISRKLVYSAGFLTSFVILGLHAVLFLIGNIFRSLQEWGQTGSQQ